MRNFNRIFLVVQLCSALALFVTPALAQNADTAGILCAQPWEFYTMKDGADSIRIRVFQGDGTFTTQDVKNESGTWSITGKTVTLAFAENYVETISLPLDPDDSTGVDAAGKPMEVVQFPPPAPPATQEAQAKAADLVYKYHDKLVVVTGKEGAGSGFVAAIGKSNFFLTNAHVVAGIANATLTTLDGTALQQGAFALADDRDVFSMEVPAKGVPFEIMQDVDRNAAIGDDVVVLGNANGAGVVNTLIGKLLAIGPDYVEVNAPFIPGNSGSPIIHLKTGKVIGIATFHRVLNHDVVVVGKNVTPIVRRYGYRLDNIKGWQAVEWKSFSVQSTEIEDIENMTEGLRTLAGDLEDHDGFVTPELHTYPVIAALVKQWLASKADAYKHRGDFRTGSRYFLNDIKIASDADIAAARRNLTYAYYQRKLAVQAQARRELDVEFQKLMKLMAE